MKFLRRSRLAALLLTMCAQSGFAQKPDSAVTYFYRPDISYGSASLRTPVETFFTRGFSNLVLEHQERRLAEIDWEKGWRSVTAALTNPRGAIRRYGGTERWWRDQFVPDGGRVWLWAWAPNYGGHLIAGGITYRFYAEWFEAHGVPLPRVTAAGTYMLTMFVNEMVEAQVSDHSGPASAVADLYIFDPLGILLFSFDAPAKFFAETLEAADWSPQVAFALPDGRLVNSSQNLSYKVPIPGVDWIRIMAVFGMGAASGIQLRAASGYRLGAVVGIDAKQRFVDEVTGEESVTLDWQGGLYFDRNNSLLASLVHSERYHSRWQLNVYPGVLPGALRDTGMYIVQGRNDRWSVGISFRRAYGLGLGWDNTR